MKITKSKSKYSGGSYAIIYHKEGDKYHYHREDGPAFTHYYKDGSVSSETWHMDGKLHRESGPAVTYYREDGNVCYEHWSVDDELHREDGPAIIYYNEDGSISGETWFINGKELSEKQINDIKRNLAFNRWLEQELDHENS